jgi:hypothetical protein
MLYTASKPHWAYKSIRSEKITRSKQSKTDEALYLVIFPIEGQVNTVLLLEIGIVNSAHTSKMKSSN